MVDYQKSEVECLSDLGPEARVRDGADADAHRAAVLLVRRRQGRHTQVRVCSFTVVLGQFHSRCT